MDDFKWLFERVKASKLLTICFARTLLYILSGLVYRSRVGYITIEGEEFKKRADELTRALSDMMAHVGRVNGKDVLSKISPEDMILDEKKYDRLCYANGLLDLSKLESLRRAILVISIYRQIRKKEVILSRDHSFVRRYIDGGNYLKDDMRRPFGFDHGDISQEDYLRELMDITDRFKTGKRESKLAKDNRLGLLAQMKDDEMIILAINKNFVEDSELSQVIDIAIKNENYAIIPAMLAYMDQ